MPIADRCALHPLLHVRCFASTITHPLPELVYRQSEVYPQSGDETGLVAPELKRAQPIRHKKYNDHAYTEQGRRD